MALKTLKILKNGRDIVHQDVIHTSLVTSFNFTDRLKILLGKKLIQHLEIYTDNEEVRVLGDQCSSHIQPIFKRKSVGMQEKSY